MKVRVGRLEDFPLGRFQPVDVEGRTIHIIRSPDGNVYAIRDSCPHRGASVCAGRFGGTMLPSAPGHLLYGLDGRVVQCPQHHWEFDISTGRMVAGSGAKRLVTYAVEVSATQEVLVEVRSTRSPTSDEGGAR